MRRHRLHLAVLVLAVVAGALGPAGVAVAQTTTTSTTAPPVTTTVPVTTPVTTPVVTAPPLVVTTGGGATTATTEPQAATKDDDGDGSSIPWIPIAIGVVALVVIVALVAFVARKRGASRQRIADWRRRAADATAEAGATARLLSQGTPPSGQIAQQLLASLRAFEDLEQSAPDDATADTAERARRALQTLGLAIDSDYRVRRTPGADPQQLARSQESVQNAAGETDRTLRSVYRSFTGSE